MASKLCVWGNSLGVRLPKYVTEVTGVQPGDYLFITVNDAGEIVIRAVKPRDVHSGYARRGATKNSQSVAPEAEEQW